MIKCYKSITEEETVEVDKIEKGVWVNMYNPTEKEIQQVCSEAKIKDDFIKYALDNEEKARIDIDEDDKAILFIIDTPVIEENETAKIYTTMPMGVIFVRDDIIITVSANASEASKDLVIMQKLF